jgi:hypothetical protein
VGAGVGGGPPQEQRERRSFQTESAAGPETGTKGAGGALSDSPTRLSPPVEVALVVSITFGCFVIASTVAVFNPRASPPLSNAHFLELLLLEPTLAAVALFVLRANGNLSSYGLTPNWKGAAEGLALGIVTYAICILNYLAVYPFFPAALQSRGNEMVAPDLLFGLVIAISIVNALFEEFFVSEVRRPTLQPDRCDAFNRRRSTVSDAVNSHCGDIKDGRRRANDRDGSPDAMHVLAPR